MFHQLEVQARGTCEWPVPALKSSYHHWHAMPVIIMNEDHGSKDSRAGTVTNLSRIRHWDAAALTMTSRHGHSHGAATRLPVRPPQWLPAADGRRLAVTVALALMAGSWFKLLGGTAGDGTSTYPSSPLAC